MDNVPIAERPAIPLSVVRGMAAKVLDAPLDPLTFVRFVERIDAELVAACQDKGGRPGHGGPERGEPGHGEGEDHAAPHGHALDVFLLFVSSCACRIHFTSRTMDLCGSFENLNAYQI